ncbi:MULTISPECIES: class F sortase [unclassified Streptomyces]|uniref:class F sortase n=1 Tax=unclassified Streptomyces TaxID=2593676 RepID=UPI000AA8065B|nr:MULTISPECIES: class F sortase [unclassified Streptomyces]MCP3767373.1 class F sortase [Streptomyces sp. MAR25Y5]
MGDTARRLTGLAVATAALAAVATLRTGPSDQGSPPPDFGPAAPVRAAASGEPSRATAPSPDPSSRGERREPPPERVLVSGVDLDARVRPVGVTGGGAMTVPGDPAVAGWYRFGPAPGSPRGSAVLVGHVDDDTGALGEFAALYDVRPGDRVEVRRAGAGPVAYRVVARATVPKDGLPSSTFRRTGPPVLTLVTCAPPFVPEAGGYQANLVVTAEPLPA